MRSVFPHTEAVAIAAVCAAGLLACQDTGGGAAAGPDGPGSQAFSPKGCGFKVAPRPEYKDYSEGKTDVGATPNFCLIPSSSSVVPVRRWICTTREPSTH